MNPNIIGLSFEFAGILIIAISVLLTHRRIAIEKYIDKIILKDLKLEIFIGVLGIILLAMGFIIQIYFEIK